MAKQKLFEKNVANLFGFNNVLLQKDKYSAQTILDDINIGVDELDVLCGTIGVNTYEKNNEIETDFILISTYDSEENHISSITLNQIKLLVEHYCTPNNKVIFATNIPIDIHSSKVKELKKNKKFNIVNIGYSFCLRNNLEFTEIY